MEDIYEKTDGGHCYLRARLLAGYVVIERWPARASLGDVVSVGKWAEQIEREIALGIPTDEIDFRQPHTFILDRDHGTYRVCKCGLSEQNPIHQ